MYAKTIVVGHLGRDPEMRYTPSGVPVTSFSLATTRKWNNANGEQQEKTTWFRVTCWRKLAEQAAQYLAKGRLVLVEGDIDVSAYTDKDGNARAGLELTATTVRFLSSRGEGTGAPVAATQGAPAAMGGEGSGGFSEDDIPF